MVFYAQRQLVVLLALLAAFGGGLAVDRWRRAHPDRVERLEHFDRDEAREAPASDGEPRGEGAPSRLDAGPPPGAPPRPPKLRADASGTAERLVELNRATADELTRLPGIGPALAARIIQAREREPFTSIEDLRRVRGVGAAKLERVRPLVTVSAP
jgi:competence protein ComEA